MHPLIWVFLTFVFTAFVLLRKRSNGDKKTPPGPFPLPVVGSLLSMNRYPFKTYAKWAQKYGPIFQVDLGQVRMIVISDVGLLREAFQSPALSGRPQIELMRIFSDDFKGIIGSQGALWEEQRRFTLRHLRDFGFGKNSMDSLITNEIETFLNWLEVGTPISLDRKFNIAVVNALWTITTSEKLNYDDPKLIELVNKSKLNVDGSKFALNMFLPWVSKLIPSLACWDDLVEMFRSNREFIDAPIKAHRETYHENSEPRDFIDAYLRQINKAEEGSSFHGDAGDKNLNATIFDIFLAGSLTTSTALTWGVLYLIMHLDIQKKIQEEIDTVVGKSRKPALTDRIKMPQTEALIFEILRHSSFFPAGVFHSAMTDTEFHGFSIAKGTIILPNTHYIHHDPMIWGDPQNFRPSRFLTQDGKSVDTDKTANMLIFSTGRRTCLGQPLAMTQLFLFMTGLLQRFNFRAAPGQQLSTIPVMNMDSLEPQKFQVILSERET